MEQKLISIVIVHGHPLHREGLRCLIERHPDLAVVGEASDGSDAIEKVRATMPQVVLLVMPLPRKDGLETTRDITALGIGTKVVMVGTVAQEYVQRVLKAGARGFVPVDSSGAELAEAIRRVHRGSMYIPGDLQRAFAERYFQDAERQTDGGDLLTDREFQVMCLLASGFTNKEIAEKLCISVKTVDTHRCHILKKLALRNNADIARFALKKQYIQL